MVKAGEVRRGDAEKAVQTLLDRGRETSERFNDTLQKEFSKQVSWLSERFDELEDRFEELAEKIAERVKNETAAPAKKAPAKKAPAKR
jgi:polyhydroxyalkanoate synthesis regulator phasin